MDFRLIVLLLVLIVHCQGVKVGEGYKHVQTIAPAVITDQGTELFPALKKSYTRFTGWLCILPANDIIKDIHESTLTLGLMKCLQECHKHNQGGSPKCIAVNWCSGQGLKKCQVETDTPAFIGSLCKTYSRCILLSTGFVAGENGDCIEKQDHKWDHFIEFHNQ